MLWSRQHAQVVRGRFDQESAASCFRRKSAALDLNSLTVVITQIKAEQPVNTQRHNPLWNAQLNNLVKDIGYQVPPESEISRKPFFQFEVQFAFGALVGLKDGLHDPSLLCSAQSEIVEEVFLLWLPFFDS